MGPHTLVPAAFDGSEHSLPKALGGVRSALLLELGPSVMPERPSDLQIVARALQFTVRGHIAVCRCRVGLHIAGPKVGGTTLEP